MVARVPLDGLEPCRSDVALDLLERTPSSTQRSWIDGSNRIDVVATLGRILPDLGTPAILAALVMTALLAASAVSAAHRRRGALDARTVTAAGLAIVVLTPNLHYAMLVLLPALWYLLRRRTRSGLESYE